MAKIAAIVVPLARASDLEHRVRDITAILAVTPALQPVQSAVRLGRECAVALIRVGPDAMNPGRQPWEDGRHAGVACGYFLVPGARVAPSGPATDALHTVAAGGVEALRGGDGVFAFALWNERDERLVAGVDKLGMRPLFYADVPGGGIAIASELKALVPFGTDPPINWEAWQEQVTLGFQLGRHTLVNGIFRLGPGEVIAYGASGAQRTTVECFVEELDSRTHDDAIEASHEAFNRAMARCMDAIPAGAAPILTLSAGYDSRRILAGMLARGVKPTAYTVPLPQPDGLEYESGIVRALCRRLELEAYAVEPPSPAALRHIVRVRDLAVDYESDEHIFPAILALALTRTDAVNFDGIAGDVLINGLFLHPGYFRNGGEDRFIRDVVGNAGWFRLPAYLPPLEARIRQALDYWGGHPNRFTFFYLLSRTRREISLAPALLQANVFESFCPYLDREVIATAMAIPVAQRTGANLQGRLIGRFGLAALDEVPTSHDSAARTDPRFVRLRPEWSVRGGRSGVLWQAARSALTRRAAGLRADQIARILAAGMGAQWLSPRTLRWQMHKADTQLRVAAHLDRLTTRDQYCATVCAWQPGFGAHGHWVTPL